jgi:radical SAM superfamily enzyme YgiQ (UPF0313 family)
MKVVLFYPWFHDTQEGKPSIATLAVSLPPVGLMSIAAVLKKNGHEVIIFDASPDYKATVDKWANRIIAQKPDFVGFSTITANFHNAFSVCKKVKGRSSEITTVFGGVHVSWGKGAIIEKFPEIDYVIAGEGEYSFLKLVNGDNPGTIHGLFYRSNGTGGQGPTQDKSTLCAMDDLPFPAYELIEGFPKKYAMALFSYPKHPGASVISSRGCLYHCSYCDRSVFQKSFRWNSPYYTFELVKWLNVDFGIRHIMFYDDLFTLNKNRVAKLCQMLRQYKPRITFNCIVRIGHIDDDLISELKSAGCWMVHAGIESGDQEILDSHKDGISLSIIRNDIESLHKAGLWVKGLFMMGFPGETEMSIQKTIDFACSLPLKDANLTAYTPYPGAPIMDEIESMGTFDKDWSNWSQMDCVNFVFVPKEIESKEMLEKYYGEFIRRFYHRPCMRSVYRKMLFQCPHSYWRLIRHASSFWKYSKKIK